MAMTKSEKEEIRAVIAQSLRNKFETYKPIGKTVMPFHTRLLGKDRMALFSFIQSLNTTFGTVIYEPVAEALAAGNFTHVLRGKKANGIISDGAQTIINMIKNRLETGNSMPDQHTEIEHIRAVCQKGAPISVNIRRADIYLVNHNKEYYPIDIKTAKPNIDGFEKYKENILKWTASILYENPTAKVGAMLAIPYNPYYPDEYKHWTVRGMVEIDTQIKVAEKFWDFLARKPVYADLLTCFKEVGIEMRREIDRYFLNFNIS